MSSRLFRLDVLGQAVRFLTILPWPGRPACDPARLAASVVVFPVVGLLIGACTAAAGLAAQWLGGAPLQAVFAVAASAVITGALHLDGLADSADALFSWRSREEKLQILRDSRIGTMGALAVFLVLAMKVGTFQALEAEWWKAALLAPVWGRWAAVCGLLGFPSARPDGLGAGVRAHRAAGGFTAATIAALVIGGLVCPPWGLLLGLPVGLAVWWAATGMTRSLGGLTGDGYGALGELGEVVTLVGLAALRHHGWTN